MIPFLKTPASKDKKTLMNTSVISTFFKTTQTLKSANHLSFLAGIITLALVPQLVPQLAAQQNYQTYSTTTYELTGDGSSLSTTSTVKDQSVTSTMQYGTATSGIAGFPHKTVNSDGTETRYIYNTAEDGSHTITMEQGKFTADTLSIGSRTISNYNSTGHPTSTNTFSVQNSGTLLTAGSTYSHFTNWGAPQACTNIITNLTNTWQYDGARTRLASTTTPHGIKSEITSYDSLSRVTGYNWNGNAGTLIYKRNIGRGGAITFDYSIDGARDLVGISYPNADEENTSIYNTPAEKYSYDAAGRVSTTEDASGERKLDYVKGRVSKVEYLTGELAGYSITRNYNARGHLDQVELRQDGSGVIHSYNIGRNGESPEIANLSTDDFSATIKRHQAGRYVTGFTRGSVEQNWTRTNTGIITNANTNVSNAASFEYNAFDEKIRRTHTKTNTGTWRYTYDTTGQLTQAYHPILGTFRYNLDEMGRRIDSSDNATNQLNQFVKYDNTGFKPIIISAKPGANITFTGSNIADNLFLENFDGEHTIKISYPTLSKGQWYNWNVLATLPGEGDPGAGPDAKAQLSGTFWLPPANEVFTYDADGNRLSTALWDYGWDAKDQLVNIKTKDLENAAQGTDIDIQYDSIGRRFKKTVSQYENGIETSKTETTFLWDSWELIYELQQDINLTDQSKTKLLSRKYVWGNDIADGAAGGAGGLLLIREAKYNKDDQGTQSIATTDLYPLYDGSGHIIGLSDHNNNLLATYTYGPFGELLKSSGTHADSNPWRYATKYHDPETNLAYFGYRYYDSTSGQWLSREPLGEAESLNLYAYCHNDPINYVDVLGLVKKSLWKRWNGHILYPIVATVTAAESLGDGVVDIAKSTKGAIEGVAENFTVGALAIWGNESQKKYAILEAVNKANQYERSAKFIFDETSYATQALYIHYKMYPKELLDIDNEIGNEFVAVVRDPKRFGKVLGDIVGETLLTISSTKGLDVVKNISKLSKAVPDIPKAKGLKRVARVEVSNDISDVSKIAPNNGLGKVTGQFDAVNPGPLADDIAETFAGGKYASSTLQEDLILHRAWHERGVAGASGAREFGGFWSLDQPLGSLQTRIDSALLPSWGNNATQFSTIRIPSGTTIYSGQVGSQGGAWIGGGSQVLIEGGVNPAWKIGGGFLK